MQLPSSVHTLFLAAGWKPYYHSSPARVATSTSTSASNYASAIVAEFGSLRVGTTGLGREQAASDVSFYSSLRPESAACVQPWSARLGELIAVATAHHDHIIVFVNSTGSIFAFTDPDEQLYSLGESLGKAMERLLFGLSYGVPIARDA
jgi:hypothetical protein